MYYRIKNNLLYDYADFKYSNECLEIDSITVSEYEEYPNRIVIKDDEIILNPDFDIDVVLLEKAKRLKTQENDTLRDNALNQGVEYKDVLFDSDTDQKVNLLAIVSTMGESDVITWFGMDNTELECTKEDLTNIGGLITQLHTFCWNKNAQIKALINNAKTIEEVETIEIDYNREDLFNVI